MVTFAQRMLRAISQGGHGAMAQDPTTEMGPSRQISSDVLAHILARARADAEFRDKLLQAPGDTLKGLGLHADPKWVRFFASLQSGNFETIVEKIVIEVEGESEI